MKLKKSLSLSRLTPQNFRGVHSMKFRNDLSWSRVTPRKSKIPFRGVHSTNQLHEQGFLWRFSTDYGNEKLKKLKKKKIDGLS